MGRGIAKQAASYFPELPKILGKFLKQSGNQVYFLGEFFLKPKKISLRLISFPVKPAIVRVAPDGSNLVSHLRSKFLGREFAPGFASKASLELIKRSLSQLRSILLQAFRSDLEVGVRCFLPWPGCGNGELKRRDVVNVIREEIQDFPYLSRLFIFGRDKCIPVNYLVTSQKVVL